jgi:hypothetical protein
MSQESPSRPAACGQCNPTKRWRRGLVNPECLSPRRLAQTAIKLLQREIAGHQLDFRLDKRYIYRSFGLSLL